MNNNEQVVGRKGRENYDSTKLWARRVKRNAEAELRQEKYDALTTVEKQCLCRTRPGDSKREMARLAARLKAEKAPAVKQAPLTEAQKSSKAVKRYASAIVNSATGQRI